jgi:hypothetical protein
VARCMNYTHMPCPRVSEFEGFVWRIAALGSRRNELHLLARPFLVVAETSADVRPRVFRTSNCPGSPCRPVA